MDEALQQALRWREEGKRVALATVVSTRRSAPRPVGAKLAVSEQGELAGSVSGGCVESDVVLAARDVLAGGEPRLLTYGITDDMALGVGLPCGGEIDVFVEELRDEERPDVILTVVAGETAGERLHDPELEQQARRRGRSHTFELGSRTVFADVVAPPPRLFIYGALDTTEALCRAAKLLGWRTVVADARASFATRERVPSADELLVAWPDEALAQAPLDQDTAVLVLTHDDKFDLPLLEAALRSDAFYVGAPARPPPRGGRARTDRRSGGPRPGGRDTCRDRALTARRDPRRTRGPLGRAPQGVSPADPRRVGRLDDI